MRDTQAEWMRAMRQGDYQAAWAISDAVLAARDPSKRDDPTEPYHRRWVWDGQSLRGRDVLVRCYHGLGDTLHFARYLRPLRDRTASVTLEAQEALIPLLKGIAGADRLIAFDIDRPTPLSAGVCDIEIMELAHALRLPPCAAPPPYLPWPGLRAPPAPSDAIGLCWQAGGWDDDRSIPLPLLRNVIASDTQILSLQPGKAPDGFANPEGCPAAIERTASLLTGLQLIITVDTMIAHLAGALNLRTWLLLKHDADWRWPHAVDVTLYPRMTLFRQPNPGAWQPVIETVTARLAATRFDTDQSSPGPLSFI